ncbi:gamma-glutamylcyclotransferase family protein [Niabella beijingensis]|uniref:gamma-glutamylcyclotransferase family protein n=1 Tax=Niabella beijingensis TaxID=2872700 RepID=UPI001CBC75FD|nr:gamma-glutamylcyclotransferase family protein [Niabella beijingensis]MBZ4189670.1 gamma-glutamylcyclotransferase [Niabella beijingensis]
MQSNYLFVYGSLLSGFKSPAYEYMARYFELVGPATASGTLYDLGDYPAAIPDNSGRTITGELYRIRSKHELSYALAQLDGYEGLNPEAGETADYKRELCSIRRNDEQVEAWVYWFSHEIKDKPVVESGNVLDYLNSRR